MNYNTPPRIRYVDLNPDEIVHWKYLKREKLSNGRYRYYYKDDGVDSAKKAADDAMDERSRAVGRLYNAMDDYKKNMSTIRESDGEVSTRIRTASNTLLARELLSATANYMFKCAKAKKLTKRYEKKKASSFVPRAINKGIAAVANIFTLAWKD